VVKTRTGEATAEPLREELTSAIIIKEEVGAVEHRSWKACGYFPIKTDEPGPTKLRELQNALH